MGSKLIYETMDRTFRKIRKNDIPFGGVTMVFSGDWRQCKFLVIMMLTSDCNMKFIPLFYRLTCTSKS